MALLNIQNLRDSFLIAGQVITPSTTIIYVNDAETEFGEAPYILTLTTALDYLTLKEGERVYVEAVDGNELTVIRGYDGSIARDWTPSEANPVYAFMLYTAGYYDELRDAVDFLENKPIILEMSNVDLDVASLLTHEISVSDGLNTTAGWNVAYSYDQEYLVTINTSSNLDQYSGRLRLFSTAEIELMAEGNMSLSALGSITFVSEDIWLNSILQVDVNTIRTIGAVEHGYSVNFAQGLTIADYEVLDPIPGTLKFRESGSPGFWGYYGDEWHKLGYTAQILIGQSTLYYCYLDGDHLIGANPIDIKDLSGTDELDVGDKLMLNGNPYTVVTFTPGVPGEGSALLDIGLISALPDMTPILIIRTVSDAEEGWTIRYNEGLDQWQATSILNVPQYDTDHLTIASHVDIGTTLTGKRRNLTVTGGITIGQRNSGDPIVEGTITYRQNDYYAAILVYDALQEEWTPVEVQLLNPDAYDFLSLVTTDTEGVMIRYDKVHGQWVATDSIVSDYILRQLTIGGAPTGSIDEIVVTKPVTFQAPITWDLGLILSARITFESGIRIYNDAYTPATLECNIDFVPEWTSYSGDNPHGMMVWWGRPSITADPVQRPFYELPFIDDVDVPVGKDDRSNMLPITFLGGNGGAESAHWELRWINLAIEGNEYRFPPRMHSEDYSGHIHPWSDIDGNTVVLPYDFNIIELPAEEEQIGKYQILVGTGDPPDHDMQYFRIRANAVKAIGWGVAHSSDLFVSKALALEVDETEYMSFDHTFYGDVFIKRMLLGPDPNYIGGHLVVASTIQFGDRVSLEEELVPGTLRYRTAGGHSLTTPGDFQGYRCIALDEEGEPWYSWTSLTGGLPNPTAQKLGGTLFFDGDTEEPHWAYSDKWLQRHGFFEFDLPSIFFHDVYLNADLVADYILAGPVRIGDSEWCNDPGDVRVQKGLMRFYDETLWVFADGMWKDLLGVNTVEIDIPIVPTEDGVILRYDLSGAIWEATGFIRVPATNDRIDLYLPTNIYNSDLYVEEDIHVDSMLYVQDRAFFAEMIRIGTPQDHEFEGLIRYNGDFEGYIPNIGWVSFTRHFEESLVAPATNIGQLMVSKLIGSHYDWTVATGIILGDALFTIERDMDLFGELNVDGSINVAQSIQIGADLIVPGIATMNSIIGNDLSVPLITSSLVDTNGLVLGIGTLCTVPGSIRYLNNTFQGLYEGNIWKDFGPIDLEEIFNVSPEWWNRSYGDVLIDDGSGRFMLSDQLNIGPSKLRMGQSLLSFRDTWQINTQDQFDIQMLVFGDNSYYNQISISGSMTPDITGTWSIVGTYYGKPVYKHDTLNYWLRQNAVNTNWIIAQTPLGGELPGFTWYQSPYTPTIAIGTYLPVLPSVGNAVVTNVIPSGQYVTTEGRVIAVLQLNYLTGSTLWSDLRIAGNLQVDDTLVVNNSGHFGGDIRCNNLSVTDFQCDNDAEISGSIKIYGNMDITGAVTITNSSFTQYGGRFILGSFITDMTTYLETNYNWLGGNTVLEGTLEVQDNLFTQGSLRVGLTAQFGQNLPWSNQAVTTEKQFAIEFDSVGNIYARQSIYCDHYLVLNKPDEEYEPQYKPKGAIRYTSEGPLDRGDWEGWNGHEWVAFTHTTIWDPGMVFGPVTNGDMISFNEDTGNWEASTNIKSYVWPDNSIQISVPTTITSNTALHFRDATTSIYSASTGVLNIQASAGINLHNALHLEAAPIIYFGALESIWASAGYLVLGAGTRIELSQHTYLPLEKKVYFNSITECIFSDENTYLDIHATSAIRINAPLDFSVTTAAPSIGRIRFTGTEFEGCVDGSNWLSFTKITLAANAGDTIRYVDSTSTWQSSGAFQNFGTSLAINAPTTVALANAIFFRDSTSSIYSAITGNLTLNATTAVTVSNRLDVDTIMGDPLLLRTSSRTMALTIGDTSITIGSLSGIASAIGLTIGSLNITPGNATSLICSAVSGATGIGITLASVEATVNNATGILIGGVECTAITGNGAYGIQINNVSGGSGENSGIQITNIVGPGTTYGLGIVSISGSTGANNAYGIYLNSITVDGTGKAYSIYALTGVGRFAYDLETLGTLRVGTDIESFSASLEFSTTAFANVAGINSSSSFWTANKTIGTSATHTDLVTGDLTISYTGASVYDYKSLVVGGINKTAAGIIDGTVTGIYVNPITALGAGPLLLCQAYGLHIAAINGGANTNLYGIALDNIIATEGLARGLSIPLVSGTTVNYGIQVGTVGGLGTTNAGIRINTVVSGTRNYGLAIGSFTSTDMPIGSAGIRLGALSGGTGQNYGIYIDPIAGSGVDYIYGIYVTTPTGGTLDNYSIGTTGKINTTASYNVAGTKVIGAQMGAIADLLTTYTFSNVNDVEAWVNGTLCPKINAILVVLRSTTGHGLIV